MVVRLFVSFSDSDAGTFFLSLSISDTGCRTLSLLAYQTRMPDARCWMRQDCANNMPFMNEKKIRTRVVKELR